MSRLSIKMFLLGGLFALGYVVFRLMLGFISGFVPGRQGLTESEVAAWAQDLQGQGADYFFSLNRYLFLAVR